MPNTTNTTETQKQNTTIQKIKTKYDKKHIAGSTGATTLAASIGTSVLYFAPLDNANIFFASIFYALTVGCIGLTINDFKKNEFQDYHMTVKSITNETYEKLIEGNQTSIVNTYKTSYNTLTESSAIIEDDIFQSPTFGYWKITFNTTKSGKFKKRSTTMKIEPVVHPYDTEQISEKLDKLLTEQNTLITNKLKNNQNKQIHEKVTKTRTTTEKIIDEYLSIEEPTTIETETLHKIINNINKTITKIAEPKAKTKTYETNRMLEKTSKMKDIEKITKDPINTIEELALI